MRKSSSPRRIVIFRLGSMGDTVVALPCFHAVRRAFPFAHITLLTNFPVSSKAAPMLNVLGEQSGFVDGVAQYPIGLRNPIGLLRLILRLKGLKSTTLVYMRSKPSKKMIRRESLFFRIAGFRYILCVPENDDQRLSRLHPITQELEPEASRLARCFATLGPIDLNDPAFWDLNLSDAEQTEGQYLASLLPSPFLVINTGGKDASKDWGSKSWSSFLRSFKQQSGIPGLAIIGGADDKACADSLLASWGDGAVNFCGGPSPRIVAALLARAHLFIGHDSGPLHLAQCVNIPALGLFGSFNKPKQWHPYGSNVRVIHELKGMNAISVDKVLQQALALAATPR